MKSGICPHCDKKIPIENLRCLRKKRAIYCPSCTKGVRVGQKSMIITMGVFGGAAGIIGSDIYSFVLIDLVVIMMIFAVVYSFLYLKFIGLYFPLEKAQDEDLLI